MFFGDPRQGDCQGKRIKIYQEHREKREGKSADYADYRRFFDFGTAGFTYEIP